MCIFYYIHSNFNKNKMENSTESFLHDYIYKDETNPFKLYLHALKNIEVKE